MTKSDPKSMRRKDDGGGILINPLISEFSLNTGLGRFVLGMPPFRWIRSSDAAMRGIPLAVRFFILAILTCVFSVLSRADMIQVVLAPISSKGSPITIKFGYLYELNAGFFFLCIAPLFLFISASFINSAHYALKHMRFVDMLRPNKSALFDPLECVNGINRRMFRPIILLILLLVPTVGVVAPEFNPINLQGDFWQLAFGYVQAPNINDYTSYRDLESLGRKIRNFGKLDSIDRTKWRVSAVQKGGCRGTFQHLMYFPFIVCALGIQVFFFAYVGWLLLKVFFLLYVIYFSIDPCATHPIVLQLDFADKEKQLGLGALQKAYAYLLPLVFMGALGMAAAAITNIKKGSEIIVSLPNGEPVPSINILSQSAVQFAPFLVLVMLSVFLFFLYFKVERLKKDFADAIFVRTANDPDEKVKMTEQLQLAAKQTTWPNLNFKAWLGASVPAYFLPTMILTSRPAEITGLFRYWEGLLRLIGIG